MVTLSTVQEALHRLYIAAPGASLRKEDRKKAAELVGLLSEMEHTLKGTKSGPVHLVDAAAGKAYVGLLTAELFLASRPHRSRVTMIEREAVRAAACREAAGRTNLMWWSPCTPADRQPTRLPTEPWPVERGTSYSSHAALLRP